MNTDESTTGTDYDGLVSLPGVQEPADGPDFSNIEATDDEVAELMKATFGNEGAAQLEQTAAAAPAAVAEMQTGVDPATLEGRVVLDSLLADDSISMEPFFRLMLQAIDTKNKTIASLTADQPVTVLGTTVWMGGGVEHAYTELGDIAPLADTARDHRLVGSTNWMDRYCEMAAGTGTQAMDLHRARKAITALAGLATDGVDNASRLHDILHVRVANEMYGRRKNMFPYVIFMGKIPPVGSFEYDLYRNQYENWLSAQMAKALGRLYTEDEETARRLEAELPDFRGLPLEELVRTSFIIAGFKPEMIFLPGDDIRKIAAAFLSASKLLKRVSGL